MTPDEMDAVQEVRGYLTDVVSVHGVDVLQAALLLLWADLAAAARAMPPSTTGG